MEFGEGGEFVEEGGEAEEDAFAEVFVEGGGVVGEGFSEFFFGGEGEALDGEVAGEDLVDGGALCRKRELLGEQALGEKVDESCLFGWGGGLEVVEEEVAGRGDEASDFAGEDGDEVLVDLLEGWKEPKALASDVEFFELFERKEVRDAFF